MLAKSIMTHREQQSRMQRCIKVDVDSQIDHPTNQMMIFIK